MGSFGFMDCLWNYAHATALNLPATDSPHVQRKATHVAPAPAVRTFTL
jgi:hypothetical protein